MKIFTIYTYAVDDHNDGGFLIGLGCFRSLPNTTYPAKIGVNAYYLTPTNAKGTVIQENQFNNLSFGYDLTHVLFMLW